MEKITITHSQEVGWVITQGDKSSDRMTWDEMMGLLSSLTMPRDRPCLQWMRTGPERKQMEQLNSNEHETSDDPLFSDLPFVD